MADTLPEYVTFNQGSVAVDGNTAHTTFNSKTRQLTVDLGDIAPGQTKTVTFSATVNASAYGKKFTNTAILSAENEEDKLATDGGVTVAVGTPEGYSGAKTVSKSKAAVGDTLTYSIALRNSSTATADWKNVKVAQLLHLSDTQMGYIENAEAGHGLLRMGGALVPFTNTIPRDTELYKLMSTTPGEA